MAKQRSLKRNSSNTKDSEPLATDIADSALESSNKTLSVEFDTKSPKPAEPNAIDGEEKTYCICNLPNNPSHFYIGCDKCEEWYHGKCVKINELLLAKFYFLYFFSFYCLFRLF